MDRPRPPRLVFPLRLALPLFVATVVNAAQAVAIAEEQPDPDTRAGWRRLSEEGSGFVVWESNRTGTWRVWRRNLDGTDLRPLSPEEKGRHHFCPHISPDGTRLVYLSYPAGKSEYVPGNPKSGVALHLMNADGSGDKVFVPAARAYGGDRAAVWFDNQRFAFIDGEGFTQEFDLQSGKSRRLTAEGHKENGFLINAAMTHATTGSPTFCPFDAKNARMTPQAAQGGCEPYFTHDGRWGYWMGGAGGPINRFELATRQISPILNKDDPRMPKGRGYLYFPMASRDGRFFTFAASPNQHDHDKSDYDVFVCRLDPKKLELIDRPVRYTFDPATDRYPDVYVADLELGRFAGEAPFSVSFPAPKPDGEWTWDFGDGAAASGANARHVFSKPGEYRVTARQKDRGLRAIVNVAPAAPPKATAATLTSPTEVVVAFDEPIQLQSASARFESGVKVTEVSVARDKTRLVVKLGDKLTKADVLNLAGIADLAGQPNVISPLRLTINPASWPLNRTGLVYLLQTADAPNQVVGADGKARSYTLRGRNRARLDHSQVLVLTGGSYLVEGAENDLLSAFRPESELTVEALVQPDHLQQKGPARIVTFSSSPYSRNFTLGQEGDHLIFRLRTTKTDLNGVAPEVMLGPISTGAPQHVAVTYRPGELSYYRDGALVRRDQRIQGDFSNWSEHHFLLGDEFSGERQWAGRLEGIAVFNRALSADEVRQDFEQYRNLTRARAPVPRIEVDAELVGKSSTPTLEEIKPYRSALVVYKYRVKKVLSGELREPEALVAHWALLDGRPETVTGTKPGTAARLVLEPFDRNAQLQRIVCRDGFDSDDDLARPRFYDVRP
ncbi:MAG: LamG-like jellyroll fold domain-containing protein [Deltaproteobacteria bacterium]